MALVRRAKTETPDQGEPSRPADLESLTAELADHDPVARRRAARDLSAFAGAASPLLERLRQEQEGSVREAILWSLTRIGSPAAVDGMVECLRSEDAELRNKAIEGLKQIPDAVAPIMTGLLGNPNPDVRIFAVNVLESLRHADVENWLIEVIARDEHVNVCATAVDLLAEVGTEAAAAHLEGLKARFADEPYIAFAADLALKRIRES